MSTKEELIQRWDAFLMKIEIRFNESLQHSEDACLAQLEETNFDYYTVIKSWQGMKSQIHILIQKIDEVWYQKVQLEMKELGDFWIRESYKSSELSNRLSLGLGKFQRHLEGELSQRFYDYVMANATKSISCSQCDASIPVPMNIFRAQYLNCNFCNTVNTFEPTTQFLHIGGNIIDNIAATKTQTNFNAMKDALNAISLQQIPVAQFFWDNYKNAYLKYYESYFKERIKLNADAAERFEADMERKIKEFNTYEQIQRN